MMPAYALVSVLHLCGHISNINKRVEINMQASREEYKAATRHAILSNVLNTAVNSVDNNLLYSWAQSDTTQTLNKDAGRVKSIQYGLQKIHTCIQKMGFVVTTMPIFNQHKFARCSCQNWNGIMPSESTYALETKESKEVKMKHFEFLCCLLPWLKRGKRRKRHRVIVGVTHQL